MNLETFSERKVASLCWIELIRSLWEFALTLLIHFRQFGRSLCLVLVVMLSMGSCSPDNAKDASARRKVAQRTTGQKKTGQRKTGQTPTHTLPVTDDQTSPSLSVDSTSLSPSVTTGIDAMATRLKDEMPTGRGIVFGHVESGGMRPHHRQYTPRTDATHFDGVTFLSRSGDSKVSGHAEATARLIYGRNGLAPGVTDVKLYQTTDWLVRILRPATILPADPDGCDVFTHSWIGGNSPGARHLLRRLDHMIDQHDTIVIVGVNNGGNSKVPTLLATAYNVIAVGSAGKLSSTGYTQIKEEVIGRCKPDLVGHMKLTSFNTPVVAGVVGRLLEQANRQIEAANSEQNAKRMQHARRAEVIKAVLLAGADKRAGFEPENGKPLDAHHGAGSVRFDTSYRVLTGGPLPPTATPTPTPTQRKKSKPYRVMNSWDFNELESGEVVAYELEIEKAVKEVCVSLVWHRHVLGKTVKHPDTGQEIWIDAPTLANFNLALTRADGDGAGIIAKSVSKIDNVEHIYLKDLQPGRYTINVSRNDRIRGEWEYAVAWRIE